MAIPELIPSTSNGGINNGSVHNESMGVIISAAIAHESSESPVTSCFLLQHERWLCFSCSASFEYSCVPCVEAIDASMVLVGKFLMGGGTPSKQVTLSVVTVVSGTNPKWFVVLVPNKAVFLTMEEVFFV